MAKVYKTTFKLRRGKAAEWSSANPILAVGEPGFEVDTFKLKIGDGSTAYNDLPYIGNGKDSIESGVVNALTHYDFPSIGNANVIYKAQNEKKIYQWNPSSMVYEVISEGGNVIDIELINGGNAYGTNS